MVEVTPLIQPTRVAPRNFQNRNQATSLLVQQVGCHYNMTGLTVSPNQPHSKPEDCLFGSKQCMVPFLKSQSHIKPEYSMCSPFCLVPRVPRHVHVLEASVSVHALNSTKGLYSM